MLIYTLDFKKIGPIDVTLMIKTNPLDMAIFLVSTNKK